MKTMCITPQELDWVSVRSACAIEKVFARLMQDVEADVQQANSLPKQEGRGQLGLSMDKQSGSYVVRRLEPISPKVSFRSTKNRIEVTDEINSQTFLVSLTINAAGRCVLKLEDGTEWEHWQLRKAALEAMFFGV